MKGKKISKWTKEEKEKLVKLRKEGKTFEEISGILNRGVPTVRTKWYEIRPIEDKPENEVQEVKTFMHEDFRKEFHVGQKIKLFWGIGSKRPKKSAKKGVITGKYNHHVVVKFQNGISESFQYFDLMEAVI